MSYVVMCTCSVVVVDWSYRANYVRERHGIEVEWANEALESPTLSASTLIPAADRDVR